MTLPNLPKCKLPSTSVTPAGLLGAASRTAEYHMKNNLHSLRSDEKRRVMHITKCMDCASQPRQIFRKKSCKGNSVTIKDRVLQHRAQWTDTTGKLSLVCFYPVKGSRIFCLFFWELTKIIAQSFYLCKPTERVSSNFIYLN